MGIKELLEDKNRKDATGVAKIRQDKINKTGYFSESSKLKKKLQNPIMHDTQDVEIQHWIDPAIKKNKPKGASMKRVITPPGKTKTTLNNSKGESRNMRKLKQTGIPTKKAKPSYTSAPLSVNAATGKVTQGKARPGTSTRITKSEFKGGSAPGITKTALNTTIPKQYSLPKTKATKPTTKLSASVIAGVPDTRKNAKEYIKSKLEHKITKKEPNSFTEGVKKTVKAVGQIITGPTGLGKDAKLKAKLKKKPIKRGK